MKPQSMKRGRGEQKEAQEEVIVFSFFFHQSHCASSTSPRACFLFLLSPLQTLLNAQDGETCRQRERRGECENADTLEIDKQMMMSKGKRSEGRGRSLCLAFSVFVCAPGVYPWLDVS